MSRILRVSAAPRQARGGQLNESPTGALERRDDLRQAWAKGIESRTAGELDFCEIRRKASARLKRKHPKA